MRILVDDEFALAVSNWITLGAPEEFFAWHSAERLNSTPEAERAKADVASAANVESP